MKFIDQIQIKVQSGKGGDGITSFMRAKYLPKLGPDGGDGGNGGNVYFIGSNSLNSLSHLNYNKIYKAQDGQKGGKNGCTGKDGKDIYIPVPLGTIIKNAENDKIIAEITNNKQTILIAKGGLKGLGNKHFVSSTHQAPQKHTCGEKTPVLNLKLELKLIANVGLVGLTNAGKSTILSKISAAKPKIADYPFTTITPHIGTITIEDTTNFITKKFSVADIPGLIKDASKGKGLGLNFLKHIERTQILCFVIDGFSTSDPNESIKSFKILQTELKNYNAKLLDKPSIIVINKLDLMRNIQQKEKLKNYFASKKYPIVFISAMKEKGLQELTNTILKILETQYNNTNIVIHDTITHTNKPKLSNYKLITDSI